MSPDASPLELAYVGAVLGNVAVLALLWRMARPWAGGRRRYPGTTDRGRAGHGTAVRPARAGAVRREVGGGE